MATVVVLVSGGLKSAVAATRYSPDNEIILLHVDYGQPSAKAQRRALRSLVIGLPQARGVGVELPYVAGMERHVVPADDDSEGEIRIESGPSSAVTALGLRGLMPVLISVAAQHALRFGAHLVVTGLTDVDDTTSPLVSFAQGNPGRLREFIQTCNMMIETTVSQRTDLRVEAPLIDLTYTEVVKLGVRLELPFEHTWSCESRSPTPCSNCPSCHSRSEAFAGAATPDPLMVPATS